LGRFVVENENDLFMEVLVVTRYFDLVVVDVAAVGFVRAITM